MRAHWREIDYWVWLWRERVRSETKVGLGAVVLLLLLGGGWFAADRLTAAHAGVSSSDSFVLETTVEKVVTVHERGKVIRKTAPVVKKVYLPRQTAVALRTRYEKQLVRVPGPVRVVRRLVTTYVPVVKTQLVKVNGKTRTVVRTVTQRQTLPPQTVTVPTTVTVTPDPVTIVSTRVVREISTTVVTQISTVVVTKTKGT